jgi:hypothetical protein
MILTFIDCERPSSASFVSNGQQSHTPLTILRINKQNCTASGSLLNIFSHPPVIYHQIYSNHPSLAPGPSFQPGIPWDCHVLNFGVAPSVIWVCAPTELQAMVRAAS